MIITASALLAALCALAASAATYRRAYKLGVEVGKASATTGTPPASWVPVKRKETDEIIRKAKSDRAHLRKHVDEYTIRIIEARFQTHLPAFQQRGDGYNTLDAMRRDAGREVTLYLRQQLELAELEAKD